MCCCNKNHLIVLSLVITIVFTAIWITFVITYSQLKLNNSCKPYICYYIEVMPKFYMITSQQCDAPCDCQREYYATPPINDSICYTDMRGKCPKYSICDVIYNEASNSVYLAYHLWEVCCRCMLSFTVILSLLILINNYDSKAQYNAIN